MTPLEEITRILHEGAKHQRQIARELELTRQTTAQHLQVLEENGHVKSEKQGRKRIYYLRD